jgi:hypothetical protein
MAIKFDQEKCWIEDVPGVKLKRYLSQTRLLYREGGWIRDSFLAHFPALQSDAEGNLFYDLTSLSPVCVPLKHHDLSSGVVPSDLLQQFEKAIEGFRHRVATSPLNFNEEISSKELTIPNPLIHPELYQVVEGDAASFLIVLWGLESTRSEGNLTLEDALGALRLKFSGAASAPRVPVAAPVLEAPVVDQPAETILEPVVESMVQDDRLSAMPEAEEEPSLESLVLAAEQALAEAEKAEEDEPVSPVHVVEPVDEVVSFEPVPAEAAPQVPAPETFEPEPPANVLKISRDRDEAPVPDAGIPDEPMTKASIPEETATPVQKKPEPLVESVQPVIPGKNPAPLAATAIPASVQEKPKPAPVKPVPVSSRPTPTQAKPSRPVPVSSGRKPAAQKSRASGNPLAKFRLPILVLLVANVAVLVVLLVRDAMVAYLGANYAAQAASDLSGAPVWRLDSGKSLTMPNGVSVTADRNQVILMPLLTKEGRHVFDASKGDEGVFTYVQGRNDMVARPVASLQLSERRVSPGTAVKALMGASFHEDSKSALSEWSIDWGVDSNGFVPLASSEAPVEHVFESEGSYRVTLLVKDASGAWDHDSVTVEVVSDKNSLPALNHPPVADAVLRSVEDTENGYVVTVSIDQCHDVDGEIAEVMVDWGDDSSLQSVDFKRTPLLERRYGKKTTRASIRVFAVDDQKMRSTKPALLQVDFQSPMLNDVNRFGKKPVGFVQDRLLSDGNEGGLQVLRKIKSETYRNKAIQHWVLCNPPALAGEPLSQVVWTIRDGKGGRQTVLDSREVLMKLSKGRYTVEVTALDRKGNEVSFRQSFSVDPDKQLSGMMRMMDGFANRFAFPSLYRALVLNKKS